MRAGKIINHYKVAKHFTLTIRDGFLGWARKQDAIHKEELLDGIYVIRTSEPIDQLTAPDGVRSYKRLALVEQCFRCFKGIDLLVRPIHHRIAERVRSHILLCLLAFYVEWHHHHAKAWEPLLFEDEELDLDRDLRDPVAPAQASASARPEEDDAHDTRRFAGPEFSEPCWLIWERSLRNTCVVTGRIPGRRRSTRSRRLMRCRQRRCG